MKYNIWDKWDRLKVCLLGNNYIPEFFNNLNTKAESPLKQICNETLEDLDNFKTILKEFGVDVIQPELDPKERFVDNPSEYPRGPLQPRDHTLVIANECYISDLDHPSIAQVLKKYNTITEIKSSCLTVSENFYNFIAGSDYPSYNDYVINRRIPKYFKSFVWEELQQMMPKPPVSGAYVFPIGKDLTVGYEKEATDLIKYENEYHIPSLKKFNVNYCPMEGHMDANFLPLKPGVVLSLRDVQNYSETLPGWDICYLPEQSWSKVKGFNQLKKKNKGKWWLAGEEDNDEFTHFVETWLQDWVGYVEETVFDVNVLMLDEHHCCVSSLNNEKVNKFLKKHKIEPVYVPWRHRYFWDGGLHCITTELVRGGSVRY